MNGVPAAHPIVAAERKRQSTHSIGEPMKKFIHLILAAFLFCAGSLAAPAARAQQSKYTGGLPQYDKATEVTTSGTIRAIERQQDLSTVPGTYVTLQTVPLSLSVHMGMWNAAKMPFHVGDQVQVTGSLITVGGKQMLLARTVSSASQTITVRTTGGQPLRPSALASNLGGSR